MGEDPCLCCLVQYAAHLDIFKKVNGRNSNTFPCCIVGERGIGVVYIEKALKT